MAFVYMLKGQSGRYYIGATENLDQRLTHHNNGMVHSTKRLGIPLELIASRNFPTMNEALKAERMLKNWKAPTKAFEYLKNS